MKRTTVHAAFAVVALACGALAGFETIRLVKAQRVNREVAAVARELAVASTASTTAPAGSSRVAAPASGTDTIDSHVPRPVQLAQAVALSAQRRYDAAARRFDALIEDGVDDETGRAALFDFANMSLREAQGNHDSAGAASPAPMIEQAKARYRALLRIAPDDWDARYNLELALRLAPEQATEAPAEIAKKSQIKLRGAQSEDLP